MHKIHLHLNDLPVNLALDGDVAIDTETMGLNISRDRLCLLQISNGNHEAHLIQFNGDYSAPNLKKVLLNHNSMKIFHFARFDVAVIKHYLKIDLENIFCTKIASKLLRTYTEFHGYKDLCRELLNIPISKVQQSSYWGNTTLSAEQQEYAAKDVLYLHQIRDIFIERLMAEDRYEIAKSTFKFLPVMCQLDIMGWNENIFAH